MRVLSLILVLSLSGCSSYYIKFCKTKQECEVQTIQVKVPVDPPAPPDIPKPELPITKFTDEQINDPSYQQEIQKAIVMSIESLVSWSLELQKALDAYKGKK